MVTPNEGCRLPTSEVNEAKKRLNLTRMNKNSDHVHIFPQGVPQEQCPQLKFFQTSGII